MIRAVIDTNVIVSAVRSKRSTPARVLDRANRRAFRIVTSPDLVAEVDEVLHREHMIALFGIKAVEIVLTELRRTSQMIYGVPLNPGVTRDPKDDHLVALYRHAGADFLVTGDKDLLEADLADVRLRTPAEFLAELRMR